MDAVTIGGVGMIAAVALIAIRFNIGIALSLTSIAGIAAIVNVKAALGIISAVVYDFVGDWNLTAVPMFLLMGYLASETGMTRGLFTAMRQLLSRLPGGLAIATVGACGLFAAASGSSIATSAAMSRIATPEMLRYGYAPSLASGVVAASGTLGSLIPPSILLLLFGFFAEVSVGQLFLAGVLPGILSMAIYGTMIWIRCVTTPKLAPRIDDHPNLSAIVNAFREIWPLPVLIFGVLLGIFFGVFTPTEAGAIGALLACFIAVLKGNWTKKAFLNAVRNTVNGTSSIFLVVIGTVLLTKFLALTQVPMAISNAVLEADLNVYMIVLGIAFIYLILGMFVDSIGLMLLTLPIILPVAGATGIDLIWLGIIVVKLLEIGLVTPPVGLNVYVIKASLGDKVSLVEIFRGVTWFIAADILTLVALVMFPVISLWLPELMF